MVEGPNNRPETPTFPIEYTDIVGEELKFTQDFQLSSIGPMTLFGGLATLKRGFRGLAHEKLSFGPV